MRVFTGISELYTPFSRIERAALAVQEGRIAWVGPADRLPEPFRGRPATHLGERGVVPGLVDSHTHLVWAGSRLEEYAQRARGASYAEILEAGGGIHATTRATQGASEDELFALARDRAHTMLETGVTTLEVKSGYGLEAEHELKLLRVVHRLNEAGPQRFVPTLLAHVIPDGWDRADYLEMFRHELIPEAARAGLAEALDVFVDRGAYTLAEAELLWEAGLAHGLKIKAHAEQLSRTGAARRVAELGGLSADHLEAATPEDWDALAAHGTVGTLLPGATLLLRQPFPDARSMWDAGVTLAVATDHNPGSSPFYNLWLALQLAVVLGRLTLEEALRAGTAHAAEALARPRLGRLEPGSPADFVVVDSARALEPLYRWGETPVWAVYMGGKEVSTARRPP